MDRFGDKYDLTRIPKLPEEMLNVGIVTVSPIITEENENDENVKKGSSQYLVMVDDFDVKLSYINKKAKEDGDPNEPKTKRYSFMLVLPLEVIQDKIDLVNLEVGGDILRYFILPFALFSLFMMIFISYLLQQMSVNITDPIVDL